MSLIIQIDGDDVDLLTINARKLDELNTLAEEVLLELAQKIISEFKPKQIEQLVAHFAKLYMAQESYKEVGFRGLLGNILSAFINQHDGERAFHDLCKARNNLDFPNTFEFSEESRKVITCLHKIAADRSKTTKETIYLDTLGFNLFESVLEPIIKSRGIEARSPSMYYVSYILNQLRINKAQIDLLFNRSILQEPLARLEEAVLSHPQEIQEKTAEIMQSVGELQYDSHTNTAQLAQAVYSTEQVLTGKMPVTAYTKEAQALTNTHLKDLGLLMLALASSLLLLSVGIVATGGSNLIAGSLVLGSLCAADYGYSFFNSRVFDTPANTKDVDLAEQRELVPVNN